MQTLLADVKSVSMRQEARNDSEFSKKNAFTVHILENKLNVYITISNTDEHLISPYDSATC